MKIEQRVYGAGTGWEIRAGSLSGGQPHLVLVFGARDRCLPSPQPNDVHNEPAGGVMLRHRLLVRQVRKHLGSEPALTPEWERLLAAVQEAYEQFDNDRRLTERAEEMRTDRTRERETLAQQRAAELAKANEALRGSLDALASVPQLDDFLGQVMAAITRQLGAVSSTLRVRNFEQNTLPLELVFQDGRVMTPDPPC